MFLTNDFLLVCLGEPFQLWKIFISCFPEDSYDPVEKEFGVHTLERHDSFHFVMAGAKLMFVLCAVTLHGIVEGQAARCTTNILLYCFPVDTLWNARLSEVILATWHNVLPGVVLPNFLAASRSWVEISDWCIGLTTTLTSCFSSCC